jgi:hypothetical protein
MPANQEDNRGHPTAKQEAVMDEHEATSKAGSRQSAGDSGIIFLKRRRFSG